MRIFLFCMLLLLGISDSFAVLKQKKQANALPITALQDTLSLEAQLALGKKLFRRKCARCHHKNMKDDMTGPALAGTEAAWTDYPRADLYAWIRNSRALIKQKHPKAIEIHQKWKGRMSRFSKLTDVEIEAILAYIRSI